MKAKKKNYTYNSIDTYVKHLPGGDLRHLLDHPLIVTEFDLIKNKKGIEDMFGLKCQWSAFKETNNPLYVFHAFLIAHEAGLHPPQWVLNYMAKKFDELLKKDGPKSLDVLFKFTKKGKGKQTPPLDRILIRQRDSELMDRMVMLETLFGCKVYEAVKMVHEKFCVKDNQNMIGLSTLERIHSRLYDVEWYETCREIFSKWTFRKKRNYLKAYSDSYIPKRLRNSYSLK